MKNQLNVTNIATLLEAKLRDSNQCNLIHGAASIQSATQHDIAYGRDNVNKDLLQACKAGAIILSEKLSQVYTGDATVLIHSHPELAFKQVIDALYPDSKDAGAHVKNQNYIADSAFIHKSACISPTVTIGQRTRIGEGVTIHAGCHIGDDCVIGSNTILYPNVVVYKGTEIGGDCIIHANASIGVDGFGYVRTKEAWNKIKHIGRVVIQNHVEIGAGTCIDRGMLDDTVIESGVKLDNLILVGHNVKIGARTAMAACTGIAGSTTIGSDCMIGGGSIINGHIEITNQTVLCGGSCVMRAIKKPGIYGSVITILPHKQWLRLLSLLHKLSKVSSSVFKKLGLDI